MTNQFVDASSNVRSGALHFTIPARTTVPDGRGRAFVSPSVASVAVTVSGIATTLVANVGGTSSDCTTTATTQSCTIPLAAPVGTDTFAATLYDRAGATGNVLGSGASTSVVNKSGFAISLSVSGAASSLALAAAATSFTSGAASSTTLSIAAFDADKNEISGSYASPVTLTLSNASAFTLTPAVVSASGAIVTLAYDGTPGVTGVTISAKAKDVAAGAVIAITIPVTTGAPPAASALTLSSTFLQFDDVGLTSNQINISGSPPVNFAAMTATTSDAAVATATLDATGKSFTVRSTGVGSATITVVPSDGSAKAATLTVHVQSTTVEPSLR